MIKAFFTKWQYRIVHDPEWTMQLSIITNACIRKGSFMKFRLMIMLIFTIVFLSNYQTAWAELIGNIPEQIKPVNNENTLTKEFLLQKYNIDAGKKSYETSGCALCHNNAIMGAPKPGDKKSWASRLNNGWDQIVKHSLFDFKGMPAKGGNNSLSEKDIENIDAYLIWLVLNS